MAEGNGRKRALLAFVLAAGCSAPPPPPVGPVRLYASPGLPGAMVADLARSSGIAEPTLVGRPEEAEVAWLKDPTEALALGALAAPGSAPAQPGVPDKFADPAHRFSPLGAVARVLVVSERAAEAGVPGSIRELGDPRFRGKVALAKLDRGGGPLFVAALELGHGSRATRGWLDRLAANRPVWVEREEDVVARVVAGDVPFGLTDSLTAGSAAVRGGVRVLFTDQGGKGCVAIPTAMVVLPGAGASARRLSAWLAGPVAEKVLSERVIGLLPLRDEATAPGGMLPMWRIAAFALDWDALAKGEAAWTAKLSGKPLSTGPR